MSLLFSADLHLSERPKDRCRFGLFSWLAKQQVASGVGATFLLGDLTESKDKHPASLVNKIIEGLLTLQPPIYILMGNHDYIDPANPFFDFLNAVEGIEFITQPTVVGAVRGGITMIPHLPTQELFDAACALIRPGQGACFHQCFAGAIAETGARLSGLGQAAIEQKRPAWALAGDIHRPQQVGCVSYVGAPYHVRFGDDYTPRVLLLDGTKQCDLHFPCPRKWKLVITDHEELAKDERLKKGDQVMIEYTLTREEVVEWASYRERALSVAKEMGLEVFGIELKVAGGRQRLKEEAPKPVLPEDVFAAFCKAEKVASNIKEVGFDIMKG